VAERCVEEAIRHRPGFERWSARETASVTRPILPEDGVSIPAGGTAAPAVEGGGLHWDETMRGAVDSEGVSRAARFEVTIVVPDVPAFVADAAHPGQATGRVWVKALTTPEGSPVAGGSFHLFLAAGDPLERTMVYELPFHAADDRPWSLRGVKHVRGHRILDFWRATTTLETQVAPREGPGPTATGTLRLGVRDVARLIASMRAVRGGSGSSAVGVYWLFVSFYARTVLRLYVAGKRARRP
jgi:hypothetical protein